MTYLVSVIGILLCLHFVSFPCKGKITIVNNTEYAEPGDDVEIEWNFTNPISDLISRSWSFVKTGEPLADINSKGVLTIEKSSLPGVKVTPPATLILENVDRTYNGTYSFLLVTKTVGDTQDMSYVTVIVQGRANLTINCSSPTIVDEGSDVRCLCKDEGGNPPSKVIWYDKNGGKIGVEGDKEKMLTLNNVNGTYSGIYKCVARSHTLTAEKSIEVKVRPNFQPLVTSFTSKPEKAVLDDSVTLKCEASARPSPVYIIYYNGTEVHNSTDNTYEIPKLKVSQLGMYACVAQNKVGISPPVYYSLVVEEKAVCNKLNDETKWYIVVVSLVSGIIIGILLSYIFVCSRRQFRNRRPSSNPSEPEPTSRGDTIYQDLDLSQMNSEDNYEPLKVNSGRKNAVYENQNV